MISHIKKTIHKIPVDNIAKIIIYFCSTLIALFITITSYIYYIDTNDMSWRKDNPLTLFICFIFTVLFINIVSNIIASSKKAKIINHILFLITFSLIMILSAWWIINAQSLAQSDPQALHDIALNIIQNNDFSAIAPQDSYLSLWPFQSGILLYFEAILRIIPNLNVIPMECLNWCYLGLGLISGYFLMRNWFNDERIITCWSLLLCFCWPWFFYVNFAYGEIPSISLMLFTTWMLTCHFETPQKKTLALALISTALGMLLRKNLSIFVVAIVLVLFVMWLKNRDKHYIITIISLLLVTIFVNTVPQKIYEYRANSTMGDGVSAYGYIAMGLQETDGISPGWNNGYHSATLIESGYNTELANALNKQSIYDSLAYMIQHPTYACDFFYRKLVPEWCDQNFSCLYSTSQIYYNRTDAAWKIYNGSWTKPILQIMNIYQSILYSGLLLFCIQAALRWIKCVKSKENVSYSWKSLWQLIFLITIIGGFIFYAFWEGGSRYTLPYMVCMLPYAAVGITNIKKK